MCGLYFLVLLILGGLGYGGYTMYTFHQTITHQSAKLAKQEKLLTQHEEMATSLNNMQSQFSAIKSNNDRICKMMGLENPLPGNIGGAPGNDIYTFLYKLRERETMQRLQKDMKMLNHEIEVEKEKQESLLGFLGQREAVLRIIPSINPAPSGYITSGFAYRHDPFTGEMKLHKGLDIAHEDRINILASADGVVVSAEWRGAYGRTVMIDHGFGLATRYCHLSEIKMKVGDKVRRGDVIGRMGMSGRATGNHLHYEVLFEGKEVNPQFFILG